LKQDNELDAAETDQNSTTPFCPSTLQTLANQRVSAVILSLWDGCENTQYNRSYGHARHGGNSDCHKLLETEAAN